MTIECDDVLDVELQRKEEHLQAARRRLRVYGSIGEKATSTSLSKSPSTAVLTSRRIPIAYPRHQQRRRPAPHSLPPHQSRLTS